MPADGLRQRQVASINAVRCRARPRQAGPSLLSALAGTSARALADPDSEQAKDSWDLAVFGHRGNLSFTAISQPWLRRPPNGGLLRIAPSPRRGAARVRAKINALGLLSEACEPGPIAA